MPDDLASEIQAMSDALAGGGEEAPKEEVEQEAPPEETPKEGEDEETEELEPEQEEEPPTDSGEEEETGEEETEEEPETDPEIINLRAEIAELKAQLPKKEEVKEEEIKPPEIEPQDFLKDVDVEELIGDREKLNSLFNSVYQSALEKAREYVTNGLKSMPEIVRANIEQVNQLRELREGFYNANPDLKPFGRVVAAVFEEVFSANQGKPLNEVTKLVATETRKKLGLKAKAQETVRKGKTPAIVKKKGTSHRSDTSTQKNDMVKDIEAMNKALEA